MANPSRRGEGASDGSSAVLEKGFKREHKLLDAMNCGVMERNNQNRIVFMNERLRKWLGYSNEEILGEPVETVIPPEIRDLLRSELDAVEAGDVRARLTVVQRKDSSTFL